jgi:hypothetical protein
VNESDSIKSSLGSDQYWFTMNRLEAEVGETEGEDTEE